MKKNKSLIIRLIIILAGFTILFYPMIADYLNNKMHGTVVNNYAGIVKKTSQQDLTKLLTQAHQYNQELANNPAAFYHPSLIPGYNKQLRLSSTDVMAFIDIPKIKVHLPIYHGTSESILGDGIGHMRGTSLPVGGKSTHSVLVGHRGLPSATLFTDLDEIKKGDYFMVTVLNKKLTYKVDAIHIVKPRNTKYLHIVKGKDYCTLLTCTPYGINTERMLVRGHRVKNLPESKKSSSRFYLPLKKVIYYSVVTILVLIVLFWLFRIVKHSRMA